MAGTLPSASAVASDSGNAAATAAAASNDAGISASTVSAVPGRASITVPDTTSAEQLNIITECDGPVTYIRSDIFSIIIY